MTLVADNRGAGIPNDQGPALQCLLTSAQVGLPTTATTGATVTGSAIPTNGWQKGAVGLTSDHPGTLSVQRYLDAGCTIPLGAAITVAVVAATAVGVSWQDGVPIGGVKVSFINSAGATATLSAVTGLLQAA